MDEQNSDATAEVHMEPFIHSGDCWDEVTFEFDGGKKLYVSQNFLSMASPVFKAMFERDFEEKKNGSVKLVDITFEDMLEFLKCLHPNLQKPVTSQNVLLISDIAEQYQCTLIIKRCKVQMSKGLKSELKRATEAGSDADRYECAQACLKLLIKADSLHYEDQLSEAVNTISRFNYKYFTGKIVSNQNRSFGSIRPQSERKVEDVARECNDLFQSLTEEMQNKLLMQRLTVCDKTIPG